MLKKVNNDRLGVKKNTFTKKERLYLKEDISALFSSGKRFHQNFITFIVKQSAEKNDVMAQVLISVPKKHVKKASNRNKIKRRIKEAYRLNKEELLEACKNTGAHVQIGVIYRSSEIKSFDEINKCIQRLASFVK